MKTIAKVFFLILILFAFGLIFFEYYHNPVFLEASNSLKILNETFEKMKSLKNWTITYKIFIRSLNKSETGKAFFTGEDKKSRVVLIFQTYPSNFYFSPIYPLPVSIHHFYLTWEINGLKEKYNYTYPPPEGNFTCHKVSLIEPSYYCKPINFSEFFLPLFFQIDLRKWEEIGLTQVSYLGKEKILGRECFSFRYDIDLRVFKETEFSHWISNKTLNLTFFSCYDEETGMPFIAKIKMGMKRYTVEMDYEVVNFTERVENLPYIPKYELLESFCDHTSNEIKFKMRALEDLPAQKAFILLEEEKTKSEVFLDSTRKGKTKIINFTSPIDLGYKRIYQGKFYINNSLAWVIFAFYCDAQWKRPW